MDGRMDGWMDEGRHDMGDTGHFNLCSENHFEEKEYYVNALPRSCRHYGCFSF